MSENEVVEMKKRRSVINRITESIFVAQMSKIDMHDIVNIEQYHENHMNNIWNENSRKYNAISLECHKMAEIYISALNGIYHKTGGELE